jgi:hypothetical protein
MLKSKEAVEEYIKIIYDTHKLTLIYIDSIINLPSVDCKFYSDILKSDDILLKIYNMNGNIKNKIIRFYHRYVNDFDVFVDSYCKKNKISNLEIKFDMPEFMQEVKKTISVIEHSLDTKPKIIDIPDTQIVLLIKDMFDSIDRLMSMEYKIRSIIDYNKLDLHIGKSFRIFRSNVIFYKAHSLVSNYPQSGDYNACKTFFLPALDNLTKGQDKYW